MDTAPARRRRRRRRASRGFTLVELLVALCVLGILLAVSVQFTRSVFNSMQLASFTNTFLAQLYLARSEAIKRNRPVAMCKSGDGASCVAGGGWEQGWILFHDSNNNGLRDAEEEIVHRLAAMPAGFRLVGNAQVARYVSFAANGATRTTTGAFQAGTLTACRQTPEATEARQIVINAMGRPRVRKVAVASCE